MLRYLEQIEPCSILMLSLTQSQFPSMLEDALRPVTKDDVWKKFRNNGGITYMCDNNGLDLLEWSIQHMPRWKDEIYPHFDSLSGKITNNQWKAIEWMMKHQPQWITQPRQHWNVRTGIKKCQARNNIMLLKDCCNNGSTTFVLSLIRLFGSAGIDVNIFGSEMKHLRQGLGKYGRLDILIHYETEIHTSLALYAELQSWPCMLYDIAAEAASCGMVYVLDWLFVLWQKDKRLFNFEEVWYGMISGINLNTLNWLIKSKVHPREYVTNESFQYMMELDNVLFFDRLTTHIQDFTFDDVVISDSMLMNIAVGCRCKKILTFLHQQRRTALPPNFDELCSNGYATNQTIEWAFEVGMGYMYATGARAASAGDVNHLRWLRMNNFQLDVDWILEAIKKNHTHIVKWFFECSIIHPNTLELCITENRMKMVKWYATRAQKNILVLALSHIQNLIQKPFHESNMKPSRKSQLIESRQLITKVLQPNFHGNPTVRTKKLRR